MPHQYRVTGECFYDNVFRTPSDNFIITVDKKLKDVPEYLEYIEPPKPSGGKKTAVKNETLPEEPAEKATDQDVI